MSPIPSCPYVMADGQACGRGPYTSYLRDGETPFCLMHIDENKADNKGFQRELEKLLQGESTRSGSNIIDLSGFVIPRVLDLSKRTVELPVILRKASLKSGLNIEGADLVSIDASGLITSADLMCKDALVRENFNLNGANFGGINFENMKVKELVVTSATSFRPILMNRAKVEALDFSLSNFQSRVNATFADFQRSATFNGSVFKSNFDCSRTSLGSGDFSGCEFNDWVGFEDSVFNGPADFSGAHFNNRARFDRAQFHSHANFSLSSFREGAHFKGVRFAMDAIFKGSGFEAAADFSRAEFVGISDFSDCSLKSEDQLRFYGVNFRGKPWRVRFLNTHVEEVDFDDANWQIKHGRLVLQDETDLDDVQDANQRPFELVAIVYRELVNNFERRRAFDLAEYAFCGEMEMRRRNPSQRWFNRLTLRAYRLASNYGSSYGNAFGVLLLIVFAFGVLFALPRMGVSDPPLSFTGNKSDLVAIARGQFHSLEVATFQRATIYKEATVLGAIVRILEQLFVPAQAALLLLALRRRLKR
jgi:uncharacterized protein YjbI with pentapeptide repeats